RTTQDEQPHQEEANKSRWPPARQGVAYGGKSEKHHAKKEQANQEGADAMGTLEIQVVWYFSGLNDQSGPGNRSIKNVRFQQRRNGPSLPMLYLDVFF